ncbi:MAG: hypothetical protein ACI936_003612 [Paraglaciecola sp.]|jgi:hypothetical protein
MLGELTQAVMIMLRKKLRKKIYNFVILRNPDVRH